jgi:hypothetical protein
MCNPAAEFGIAVVLPSGLWSPRVYITSDKGRYHHERANGTVAATEPHVRACEPSLIYLLENSLVHTIVVLTAVAPCRAQFDAAVHPANLSVSALQIQPVDLRSAAHKRK